MKGISNIVTVAFLIAIAIAIAGIYADWAPGFARNITEETTQQSNQNLRCSNAALAISNPEYDRSGDIVEFELENAGTIRFTRTLTVTAFNSSLPVNNTSFSRLEVGESRTGTVITKKEPDTLRASSVECPDVEDIEEMIRVTD